MKKIIPFGMPIIGIEEQDAVQKVLAGPILVHGPVAEGFENAFGKYTSAPNSISVSSCTAGMHLIYFALGYGPGDEVLVPAQTHVATAHAVELTGARAVFIDAEIDTGNINIDLLEASITSKTKAIAVVHYLGVPVDMVRVMEIAKRHNLFVLEDCALAPGAFLDKTHMGLHGDVGVFSFYPVKHITTAEGGMIITKHDDLADKLRLLKAFGVNRNYGERKEPGMYDTVALGLNYRMSELHAAIGIEQLKKLPEFLRKRKENFLFLEDLLIKINEIRVLPQLSNDRFESCYYCMAVLLSEGLVNKRKDIMKELTALGVGSSIYYPKPVPRMMHYKEKYGYDEKKYSIAARISDGVIALPVGPHLDIKDMAYIARSLEQAILKVKNES